MTRSQLSRRRLLAAAGATVAASLAGCSGNPVLGDARTTGTASPAADSTGTSAPDGPSTAAGSAAPDQQDPADQSVYTRVYRETIDSVVLVSTDAGQGSGFVYGSNHVVTNAHVVGRSNRVEIRFSDGEWRAGRVVGRDVYSDLAAIRVGQVPPAATPLRLNDRTPPVGTEVVVIGNPYGLDGSLTAGVVSGVNRSIPSPAGYSIPDAIQTDAAVNPGNSGGPIVALDGDVVAVINSGGGDNVAFGISAALTRRVVADLVSDGEFDHSYMGITLREVSPAVASANDLGDARGVLVVSVQNGGPSDGTLRPSTESTVVDGSRVPVGGDVILAMGGTEIRTAEDLGSYLALHTSPGDTVRVRVLRDGTPETVRLTLGERPSPR